MPGRVVVLCLSLLAGLLPMPSLAQGWTRFTPAEGMFSVEMPAPPKRQENPIPPGPAAPGRTVLYTATADREVYLAGWGEYAPTFKFDIQAELDANRDNFVKGMKTAAGPTTRISFKGAPGIEFTTQDPGKWFARVRVYIIDNKPYQLIALVPADRASSPNIAKFLGSFQVVPARR
jgi:hypothetical protein